MDLWIRSQDREYFTPNPTLEIREVSSKFHILDVKNEDGFLVGTMLGEYKTKERALEVLDEIQNILLHKYVIRIDENTQEVAKFLNIDGAYVSTKTNGDVRNINNTFIYKMPEE